jgi:toxin ParE1/3/4
VKPLDIRRLAERDIFEAIDFYAEQAPHVVDRFMSAIDRAMEAIQRTPGIGSPAFADVLDVPGLRYRPLKSFRYAIFYQEDEFEIRVLRVLHHGRDLLTLVGLSPNDD